jgi:short-subunit dehydrogenase
MQCFINSFSEGLRKEYADKGIIVQVCNQRLICSKINRWVIWHLA